MRKDTLATRILVVMVAAASLGISHPALAQVKPQQPGSTGTQQGTMGPGMMGQGMYPGMMMGPCGMGYGMMTPDQMTMMHQGMMGGGMMTGGWGQVQPAMNLSSNDVKAYFTNWLKSQGNAHLKLGNIAEKDADTITAEIVTQDGSLAQRFAVDRHTGTLRQEQ